MLSLLVHWDCIIEEVSSSIDSFVRNDALQVPSEELSIFS